MGEALLERDGTTKLTHAQEGILGHISLEDDEPELIGKMLHYLYKCDYPNGAGETGPLVLNASIYALGDKYDIRHLEHLARHYFSDFLEVKAFNNEDFSNAVTITYNTTPPSDRGLRDCIIPKIKHHWSELRADEKFMDVVRSNCDLAIDLVDLCTASNDEATSKNPPKPISAREDTVHM